MGRFLIHASLLFRSLFITFISHIKSLRFFLTNSFVPTHKITNQIYFYYLYKKKVKACLYPNSSSHPSRFHYMYTLLYTPSPTPMDSHVFILKPKYFMFSLAPTNFIKEYPSANLGSWRKSYFMEKRIKNNGHWLP